MRLYYLLGIFFLILFTFLNAHQPLRRRLAPDPIHSLFHTFFIVPMQYIGRLLLYIICKLFYLEEAESESQNVIVHGNVNLQMYTAYQPSNGRQTTEELHEQARRNLEKMVLVPQSRNAPLQVTNRIRYNGAMLTNDQISQLPIQIANDIEYQDQPNEWEEM